MIFFRKKLECFKIAQGGKFTVECVSVGINYLKCLFHPCRTSFFSAKSRKTFKVGKIRTDDREGVLFEKKRFIFFENFLQKNMKVENMPVIAGRPDFVFFKFNCCIQNRVVRNFSLSMESDSFVTPVKKQTAEIMHGKDLQKFGKRKDL